MTNQNLENLTIESLPIETQHQAVEKIQELMRQGVSASLAIAHVAQELRQQQKNNSKK